MVQNTERGPKKWNLIFLCSAEEQKTSNSPQTLHWKIQCHLHLMQTQNDHTLIQVNINTCGQTPFRSTGMCSTIYFVQKNKISINPRKITAPATTSFWISISWCLWWNPMAGGHRQITHSQHSTRIRAQCGLGQCSSAQETNKEREWGPLSKRFRTDGVTGSLPKIMALSSKISLLP